MFFKKAEKQSNITVAELQCSDVTETLCLNCAKCCEQTVQIPLDDRFYDYLVFRGESITRDPNDPKIGILNLGKCKYLVEESGLFKCGVYKDRPQMCKDFNCVAWAKCQNLDESDPTMAHVIKVMEEKGLCPKSLLKN
jgi:Fe-S-cluster containining protein